MAVADMFLKVQGATGEVVDPAHSGEIEVVSWSWAMQASTSAAGAARESGTSMGELRVVKRVDQSTPTLMGFLRTHKLVKQAQLTVRKAGATPLEYLKIEMENVRINALHTSSEGAEIIEQLDLGFQKIRVTYTPQAGTGAKGGGANVFEADAHARS